MTEAGTIKSTRSAIVSRPPRHLALLFGVCGLALLVPIWIGSWFPTEDGPAHIYWTAVYHELGSPGSPLSRYYERSVVWNAPNLAYFALQYALSSVVEPHTAQRLIVTLILAAWIGSTWLLSRAAGGGVTLGAVAALLLFHSYPLYVGLFSFMIAVPAVVCAVALLVQLCDPRAAVAWRSVALGLLGVVVYYAHLVTAVLFVLLAVTFALGISRRSRSPALAAAAGTLPACALLASYLLGGSLGPGGAVWAPLASTLKHFFGLGFWRGFADPGAGYLASFALLAGVLATLVWAALRALRRGGLSLPQQLALLGAALLTAIFFIVPREVGQGGFLRERVQLVLWAVLLPTLGASVPRRAARVLAGSLVALTAWQVTTISRRIRALDAQYAHVLARADSIPAGAVFRYAETFPPGTPDRSWVHPLMEAGADIAYRRRAVLVHGHHPATPFYWVRARPDAPEATLLVRVEHRDRRPASAGAETAGARRSELALLVCRVAAPAGTVSDFADPPPCVN